jgi:hypothetical protein
VTEGDDLLRFVVTQVQKADPLVPTPTLGELFRGSHTLSGAEQLEIYREQFWLRHSRALEEDFPGLAHLMGDVWEQFLRHYLEEIPCPSFTLRNLGAKVPKFVRVRHSDRESWIEMADLEWAYIEAFDAPNTRPLGADGLLGLSEQSWQSAQIELNHSLSLLRLEYPVHDLRRAVRKNETMALAPLRTHLVVYRHQDLSVYDKGIDEVAFELLLQLQAGVSLGGACDALAEDPNALAILERELGNWFRTFGELGWIVGVHSPVTSNG